MATFFRSFLGLALVAASAVFSTSCSNSSDTQTPAPAPAATVVFNTPTAHQTYLPGDTVHISGTITTLEQMHGYHLHVKRTSDNAVLHMHEEHFHGKQATFSHQWVNNQTTHANLEIEVVVALDHDGNTFTGSCHVHCMP